MAVLTNESYLDCRHSNVTNSLQPQARSLQPQARSHQPQPQAPSCSTATSHVVWHQEKREAIMGVLCTQMIDVPSKAMFERTQTNELYSFCVQYSNVGGGKSAPTGHAKHAVPNIPTVTRYWRVRFQQHLPNESNDRIDSMHIF